MAGHLQHPVCRPLSRWLRRHRRSCLRIDVICICACLTVFLYLGYTASPHRDLRDVQLTVDPSGPKQDLCETSERWVLVNISANDKSDLSSIRDIHGWRLLILNLYQQRAVIIRKCLKCIFISNPHDLNTGWTNESDLDPAFLPFLYMIKRGAKWIYVTDDTDSLYLQVRHFRMGRSTGLISDEKGLFNPSSHFVTKEYKSTATVYRVGGWPKPSIQTRWIPGSRFSTAEHACLALPVLLPSGVIGLTDLRSSLYGYEAFWSLVSLTSNGSSVVWSLWKQRLLWEIRGTTAIYQPLHCDQLTPKHLEYEVDIDRGSLKSLLVFLNKWKCTDGSSFFSCVQLLSRDMRKQGYFTTSDVHHVNLWIENLVEFDVIEPALKRAHVNSTGYSLVYNVASSLNEHISALENPFVSLCKNFTKISLKHSVRTKLFQDVVLIITFNHWIPYEIMKYLNYLYSRYFSKVIYCGETLPNLMTAYKTYKKPINFMEIKSHHGQFSYKCAASVMRMGLNVKGFLQMSDDVMVNFKQLAKLPQDKPWFQNVVRIGNISSNKVPNVSPIDPEKRTYWWPWAGDNGVTQLRILWKKLKNTLSEKSIFDFLQMIKKNSGHVDRAFYETSDIFYIPYTLKDNFLYFTNLFAKDGVCRDIAVPTIMNGLSHKKDIVHMNGSYLWFHQRPEYRKYYRTNNHYLHPWPVPSNKAQAEDLKFLCDIYLPRNIN